MDLNRVVLTGVTASPVEVYERKHSYDLGLRVLVKVNLGDHAIYGIPAAKVDHIPVVWEDPTMFTGEIGTKVEIEGRVRTVETDSVRRVEIAATSITTISDPELVCVYSTEVWVTRRPDGTVSSVEICVDTIEPVRVFEKGTMNELPSSIADEIFNEVDREEWPVWELS